jgi:hypothetical protein
MREAAFPRALDANRGVRIRHTGTEPQCRVEQAEDRGTHPDGERETTDGRGDRARVAPEDAEAVCQILRHITHDSDAGRIPAPHAQYVDVIAERGAGSAVSRCAFHERLVQIRLDLRPS